MHIIFGKEVADEIRQKHLVLELETFEIQGETKTAYCVIQSGSITMEDMPDIERLSKLHSTLIAALHRNDWATVSEGISHLRGKFGGELDSFYAILDERIAHGNKE